MRGPRIELRRVTEQDLPRLLAILREPEVAVHWSEPDDAFDRRELLAGDPASGDERCSTFCIVLKREVIGWIAAWENDHRDYRHAGVDLFLSAAHQGRGIGPEAIRLVCSWLFDVQGHHRVTIDPAADNVRAIAAYEKVGFKRVGRMRKYERGSDGTYHDGMLLELIAGDVPTVQVRS